MRRTAVALVAWVLVFSLSNDSQAQDANWWTQQYGTRSELLGGAVVGSVSDLSALFYNPGAMALSESRSVLLSAKAFEYQVITVEGAQLDGDDAVTTRLSTAPSLFAGLLPSQWLPGQLGYVFLTRQQFEFRLVERGTRTGDIFGNPDDSLVGEVFVDQKLNENWGGASWFHKVTDNIGFGFTTYIGYRGQRTRRQALVEATSNFDAGGTTVIIRELDYSNYRWINKFGFATEFDELTVGTAVTLPSVSLLGDGKVFTNLSSVGFDLDGDGSPNSFLAANSQEDVPATYKSPFSLAVGGSYELNRTRVHATVEWFNNVRPYAVMDPDPFIIQSTGEIVNPEVIAELDDVINFGFGLEYHPGSVDLYASFTTDFSAAPDSSSEQNVTMSTWDIYHVTGGVAFTKAGLDLTLGLGYSWGSDDVAVLSFDPDEQTTGLIGDPQNLPVKYRKLKVFFGFAFSI